MATAVVASPSDVFNIMSRPQIGIDRLPVRKSSNEAKESMNCKSCRKRKVGTASIQGKAAVLTDPRSSAIGLNQPVKLARYSVAHVSTVGWDVENIVHAL